MIRARFFTGLFLMLLVVAACKQQPPSPEQDTAQATTPPFRSAAAAQSAPEKEELEVATETTFAIYMPVVERAWSAGKHGIAYCCGGLKAGEAEQLGIDLWYNYSLQTPGRTLENGAVYVPMFWCDQYPSLKYPTQVSYFELLLDNLPEEYSGPLLFLNEPDLAGLDVDMGQCDRTPRQAAYIYKSLLAACQNCRLIGPAVSDLDYRAGWRWLRAWYAEIGRLGLRPPDVAAIHTYLNEPPNLIVDSLFETLKTFPNAPQTAWVTEFASADTIQAASMIAFYEADPRIEHFFWFPPRNPAGWGWEPIALVGSNGVLTPVGEIYSGWANAAQSAYPAPIEVTHSQDTPSQPERPYP